MREALTFVWIKMEGRTDVAPRGVGKGHDAPATPSRAVPPSIPTAPTTAPIEVRSVASLPVEPPRGVQPSKPAQVRPEELGRATSAVAPIHADADLALYRRAHELHFGGAGHAVALAAWDEYLTAYPRGTFAPEARLNRAVCLAKLGRKAEAEDALVDIERGRFGTDGRRQARKILGALEDE